MTQSNPEWPVVAGIAGVTLLVGIGIAALALRKGNSSAATADVYYYWVDRPGGLFGDYVPTIQNARTGEIFTLPGEITESGALHAAEREIGNRGGTPQQGRPANSNPHRRARLSLRR